MSIRKFTNPREFDLSRGLQDVLMRNGMQAHISVNKFGDPELIVMGHDSPVLNYKLTDRQVEDLINWGSSFHNKKAYDTFTSIVKNDFDMPAGYVVAKNASGRVAMGLHGYRIGIGEYGYRGFPFFRPPHRSGRGWFGDFLGWAPRYQDGWHLRRINDRVFYAGGPMVPERPDGRVKPGEMRSGSYGFYYKGNRQEASQELIDQVIADPKIKITQAPKRPEGQAKPYSDIITTDLYFNNAKWQDILQSHGLKITKDPNGSNNMVLIVQSSATRADVSYLLQPEELQKLTAEKLNGKNGVSLDERLAIINKVISVDFKDKVTKEMLESKNLISVDFKPEVKEELEAEYIKQDRLIAQQQEIAAQNKRIQEARRAEQARIDADEKRISQDPNAISGRQIAALLPGQAFFRAVENGRQMVVSEIRVDKIDASAAKLPNGQPLTKDNITAYINSLPLEQQGKANLAIDKIAKFSQENDGKYMMTAMINGEAVTREINQKDYDRFLSLDDAHRLKLFDKLFDEVAIKSSKGIDDDSLYNVSSYQQYERLFDNENNAIGYATNNNVDGASLQALDERKGFYREGRHGREVEVGNITVEKDPQVEGKYKMTAVIDGKSVSHEISQKDFDRFLAVDDMQRMKLFSKIFNEVDMKTRPGMGTNVGAAILAAVVAAGDVVAIAGGLSRPRPEIYESRGHYYKPGVVHPAEVASVAFETEMQREMTRGCGIGRGV